MNVSLRNAGISVAAAFVLATAPLSLTGCDQDEEILDVESPDGGVEVERDPDTGATEIETEE
jgi:hypothetical protein